MRFEAAPSGLKPRSSTPSACCHVFRCEGSTSLDLAMRAMPYELHFFVVQGVSLPND